MTAIFIVAYLSFSLPVVIIGLTSQHFGIRDTALASSAAIAAAAVLWAAARSQLPGGWPILFGRGRRQAC